MFIDTWNTAFLLRMISRDCLSLQYAIVVQFTLLTEGVPGTHNIPGNIIGGIEDGMGNQVCLVISHDG